MTDRASGMPFGAARAAELKGLTNGDAKDSKDNCRRSRLAEDQKDPAIWANVIIGLIRVSSYYRTSSTWRRPSSKRVACTSACEAIWGSIDGAARDRVRA